MILVWDYAQVHKDYVREDAQVWVHKDFSSEKHLTI